MKEIDAEGFERILDFIPAFDKRDPDPKKNYGIHGVTMRFVLKGPLGAIQFILYTNWQLPSVRREQDQAGLPAFLTHPMPADLGYHSPVPTYEGEQPLFAECPYMPGCPCYYDGSGLNAQRPFDVLVTDGEEALWRYLRDYYRERFVDNECAEPDPINQPRR